MKEKPGSRQGGKGRAREKDAGKRGKVGRGGERKRFSRPVSGNLEPNTLCRRRLHASLT